MRASARSHSGKLRSTMNTISAAQGDAVGSGGKALR
jgi:hypothetical protein